MTQKPRFTVITPSFNQAHYLEETIVSVLGQNYPHFEYIVIDGGSTDGSVEIIKKYQDRILYWISERDRGQAHAINKGLQRVTGDIVAYINSDDYYLDDALQRVADYFSSHPEVDLVHGRCRVVDESGAKIREQVGSITRYEEIIDPWNVWWKGGYFVQPEVFWTRRIMDRVGLFREDLFWVFDYEYWVRILSAGGVVGFLDCELASFRTHSNQKTAQVASCMKELLAAVGPHIYADNSSIGWEKQLQLKGKWIYDTKFQSEVELSLRQNESRYRRWLRLLGMSLQHPEIIASHAFRERLRSVMSKSILPRYS